MAEPPPFIYDPLPAGCIRLLTPVSSEAADSYTWKLQTVALERFDLEFDALSYVWGSDSERLNITLNDCTAQVHRNLYTALPYLVRRGHVRPVRPIWIDAICINQADHEEKMVQIREMDRVYKQATKVWVWLGITKHQERIPDALRFLEDLRDEKRRQQHTNIDELYEKLCFETLEEKPALSHVVFNDWFERLWVLQEATLAKEPTFLCGDAECSWELMEDAMRDAVLSDLFDKDLAELENPFHLCDEPVRTKMERGEWRIAIFCIRTVVQECWGHLGAEYTAGHQVLMLAFAMNVSRSLICLKTEDRVLGILGLTDPIYLTGTCLDPMIPYVSVEELFTRATRSILEMGGKYEQHVLWLWLGWAFTHDKRQGLPSWVSDLHRSKPWPLLQGRYDCERTSRYTATQRVQRWRGDAKQEQLILTRKVLDEVTTVFSLMPCPDGSRHDARPEQREQLLAIANWEETTAGVATGRTSTWPRVEVENDRLFQQYWHTLVDYRDLHRDELITYDWYLEFQALGRQLRGVTADPAPLKTETEPVHQERDIPINNFEELLRAENQWANAYKFMGAMQDVSFRQLIKTKRGHLTSTMPGVMPGDVLIALNGAPILHVIRKANAAVDGAPELWEFVGDAYVYLLDCENDEKSIMKESEVGESDAGQKSRAESTADEADDEERELVFI